MVAMSRRLRALAAHVVRPHAVAAVEQEVADDRGTALAQGGAVGFPLARQDGRGQLTSESVAELTELMAAAAGRLDFRTAANLQTMLKVLGPQEAPAPLSSFTSADADSAADIFLEHGFCVLPSLISDADLQRMRGAFEAATADGFTEEAQWAAGTERKDLGKYFSFDMFSEKAGDPAAFYALADPPLLMSVIHRVLGRPVPFQGSGGRFLPVAEDEVHSETGYISWHRDISNGVAYDKWPYPFGRSIKVSTFLYDVPEDGGCLTFVPGSHRLPNAPQQTLDGTFAGGRGHYRKPLRQGQGAVPGSHAGTGSQPDAASFFHAKKGIGLPRGFDDDGIPLWVADEQDLPSVSMPNCVRCAVPAGSFVVFDTCIWHVAIPNTSSSPRVGTIAGFNADGGAFKLPEAHLEILESEGLMTPHRKAAFGLEMTEREGAAVAPGVEVAEQYVKRRTGGNAN